MAEDYPKLSALQLLMEDSSDGQSSYRADQPTCSSAPQATQTTHTTPSQTSPVLAEGTTLNLNICRVCSTTKEVGHFYGVRACDTCKTHFRKYSTATTFNSYCSQPSKCPLNRTAAQKVCTRCRYIRCLELGMHPKYGRKGASKSMDAEPRTFDATDEAKVEELRKECQAAFMEDKPLDLTVCRVCFSPQHIGIFYGVRTCTSCREFFRRQCLAATFNENCSKPSKCSLNRTATTKIVCARCRLIKCLELGMHPKYKNQGGLKIMKFAEPRTFDATDENKVEEYRKECQAAFMEETSEEGEPEARRQRIE